MRNRHLAVATLVIISLFVWGCSIQEAPPEPPTGLIWIAAHDPNGFTLTGGTITLDGVIQSQATPDSIRTIAGNHTLVVGKTGYTPVTQTVEILPDTMITLTVTLAPTDPGAIIVSAGESLFGTPKPGSAIYLDGSYTGLVTPKILANLATGWHHVGTGFPGYIYTTDSVNVLPLDTVSINIAMPFAPWQGVRLACNVDSARISMDDSLLWSYTPAVLTGLPPGRHTFSCYKPAFANQCPILQTLDVITLGGLDLSYNLTFNLTSWSAGIGNTAGKLAPGFSLQSDHLDTVSLGAYRGRVVLVNFWFHTCVPCMQEMPDIDSVYEQYSAQGFRVLAINPMYADDLQDLLEVRQDYGLEFELLMDFNHTLISPYGVAAFPTNYLIDQRGVINWRVGSVTYASLSQHVQALLYP